jgi:hypothetical protein
VGDDADLRAFCLARSRYALAHLELLEGWHAAEPGGHRWTVRSFSAVARRATSPRSLRLRFYLPPAVIERAGSVTISCAITGVELPAQTWNAPGLFTYDRPIPPVTGDVRLDFRLSYALPPDDLDPRERGIIVSELDLE